MTISREDVHNLSRGPNSSGIPLSAPEADRIAAVLNQNAHHSYHELAPAVPVSPAPAALAPLQVAVSSELVSSGEIATSVSGPQARAAASNAQPRAEVLATMIRAGYTREQVQQAASALPAMVDLREHQALLVELALTEGQLMDRMGSSP